MTTQGSLVELDPQSAGLPARRARDAGRGDAARLVVAVEATRLAREKRGIGRYVRALLPRLVALQPGLQLLIFVKRARDVPVVERMLAESEMQAERFTVRPIRDLRRTKADLVWYPWNFAGRGPAATPVVVTIHDVAPLTFPDPRFWKWRKNHRWRRRYRQTARDAALLLAVSSFTAGEVQRVLGVEAARLRVTLLAADDLTPPARERDTAALSRLGVEAPYVLAVGAADRRKNLALLERAMELVAAARPELRLVLAGPRDDREPEAAHAAWRQELGFVSEDDLVTLYRNAAALVVPSTYEGFGLPVLEAMRLGTPVICARASSLPEVGGDAALFVDPVDERELAEAILRLATDERYARAVRAASRRHEARFSWDDTARQTLAAFNEVVGSPSPRRA